MAEAAEIGVAGDERGFVFDRQGSSKRICVCEFVSDLDFGSMTASLRRRINYLQWQGMKPTHYSARPIRPLFAKDKGVYLSEIHSGDQNLSSSTHGFS